VHHRLMGRRRWPCTGLTGRMPCLMQALNDCILALSDGCSRWSRCWCRCWSRWQHEWGALTSSLHNMVQRRM
jgi:hypothetical protein